MIDSSILQEQCWININVINPTKPPLLRVIMPYAFDLDDYKSTTSTQSYAMNWQITKTNPNHYRYQVAVPLAEQIIPFICARLREPKSKITVSE